MDIEQALSAGFVERPDLLAGRGSESLLEVCLQSFCSTKSTVSDVILGVDGLGSFGGVCGFVDCDEGAVKNAGEAAGDAMLRVELDAYVRNMLLEYGAYSKRKNTMER